MFNMSWYSTYPWITLCTTRHRVFCKYCRYCNFKGVLCFATRGEDNFVTSGYNNWKKARERFLKHEQSGLHKEAILKIDLLKQESIAATLSNQVQENQKIAGRCYSNS